MILSDVTNTSLFTRKILNRQFNITSENGNADILVINSQEKQYVQLNDNSFDTYIAKYFQENC